MAISSNLKAWAHYVLLESDPGDDLRRMAYDIKELLRENDLLRELAEASIAFNFPGDDEPARWAHRRLIRAVNNWEKVK